MNQKVKYLIIGAGPTGIGAAFRLKERGEEDFLILEKNNYVGGLATSFKDENGFFWDIGGHVQFSHYDYFDKAMKTSLGDQWFHHERESWVWMQNRFIPYPFQNNIHRLPEDLRDECLSGLEEVKNVNESNSKDFAEWIRNHFGNGISNCFMLPYNFKVWAYEACRLSWNWIGERVSKVDIDRIKENIKLNRDDLSWGPNNTFQFPHEGGTGAIWNSLADHVGRNKIKIDSCVSLIDPSKKIIHFRTGSFEESTIEYEYLLSSMPLDILCGMVSGLDDSLIKKSSELMHSSTNIVGVGLKGQPKDDLKDKCWMYFPEDDCPFYRVTLFSKYSPNNVPDSSVYFSLMTEVSESEDKPVERDTLIEEVIQGLYATKLITQADEVISTWQFFAPYGYPTPSISRDSILKAVIPVLDEMGVYSRGRFGAWKYEISNQDHTFMQGVEWVNLILDGDKEETFTL